MGESSNQSWIAGAHAGDIVALLQHGRTGHCRTFLTTLGLDPGLLDDPERAITPAQTWTILAGNIRRRHDELQNLSGSAVKEGFYELIVASMLPSPTLGDALERWVHSCRLVFPDIVASIAKSHRRIHLKLQFCGETSPARDFYLEAMALVHHLLFCWLTGRLLKALGVRTSGVRASAPVSLLALIGPRKGHSSSGIEWILGEDAVSAPILSHPLEGWRDGIFSALNGLESQSATSQAERPIHDRVLRLVSETPLNQAEAARRLAMSPATLRRRLSEEGSSFREIRDEVLVHAAPPVLFNTRTVEEAAAALGFADARSFRRSFERLFGCPPSLYKLSVSENVP